MTDADCATVPTGQETGAGPIDPDVASAEPVPDYGRLRQALLERALLLDPDNAEDLTQRALEEGLALQQRDTRPRDLRDLTTILHGLTGAQESFDRGTVPASQLTAGKRAADRLLDGLDGDADASRLLYPDLYPVGEGSDGWLDSPRRWNTGTTLVLDLDEIEETDEVFGLVDQALGELPDPFGELVALVDLQGQSVDSAAESLSLDLPSAVSGLARARNHLRGRLDSYFR